MTADAAKAQEVFQDTLREAAFHSANREPPDRYWFFRQARWRCLDVTAQGVQPEVLESNLADISEHAPEQIAQLDAEQLAIWISAAPDRQRSQRKLRSGLRTRNLLRAPNGAGDLPLVILRS